MSKLIPHDLTSFAETAVRAAAAERFADACMVVYGVPIVAVTVDDLLAPLDEPFDPRVTNLIVED